MKLLSPFLTILLVSFATSAQGTSEIVWHVMASGGMGGESATTQIRSTLGQAVVGQATSASYRIQSGFWTAAGTTSGIEEDTSDLPRFFSLGEFVPNPSTGTTRISYAVPAGGGNVKISVFDVSGALVRVLADEEMPAGNVVLIWDGKSQAGRQAASGMYLVLMEASGYKAARKLLLTR